MNFVSMASGLEIEAENKCFDTKKKPKEANSYIQENQNTILLYQI